MSTHPKSREEFHARVAALVREAASAGVIIRIKIFEPGVEGKRLSVWTQYRADGHPPTEPLAEAERKS